MIRTSTHWALVGYIVRKKRRIFAHRGGVESHLIAQVVTTGFAVLATPARDARLQGYLVSCLEVGDA